MTNQDNQDVQQKHEKTIANHVGDAETTRQFIDALQVLERDRDFIGLADAREFWETYRETFGEVTSSFRNAIVSDGRAALEWTTTGTSSAGAPIAYEGVTILEMAGGKITCFRAYFDAHDLGRQMEQGAEAR